MQSWKILDQGHSLKELQVAIQQFSSVLESVVK